MKEYIEKISPKNLFYISVIGIIVTIVLYISSLFISTDYRIFLIFLIALFTITFCISQKANSDQLISFVGGVFVISFFILNFTDFYFNNHYSKNDWKSCKGFTDYVNIKSSKHSPNILHYHFYVNNKLYESSKEQSIVLNVTFHTKDSIYVVYSESNPFVNDIYLLEDGPNLQDRENFLLYYIKNTSLFKWLIILIPIGYIFYYIVNRKKGYYPIKRINEY